MYNGNGSPDNYSLRNASHRFTWQGMDLNMDYKRTFKTKGQTLEASYSSSTGNINAYNFQNQLNQPGDSLFTGAQSYNTGQNSEKNISIDYVQPIHKNTILETGVKGVFKNLTSLSDYYGLSPVLNKYNYDSAQSNNFTYQQKVYAAYVSLNFKLFDFLDAKMGERYERTDLNANFTGTQPTQLPGYNTLVPSVVFSHTFKQNQTLKIAYSRRIERPDFRDLNPYVNSNDPNNISVGNPNLKPEQGERWELSYNAFFKNGGDFNATLFYRTSYQDIQNYLIFYPTLVLGDSTYKNVAVTTHENVGSEKTPGVNLYGSYPITQKFTLSGNFNIFEKFISYSQLSNNTVTSLNYRVHLNAAYRISDNFVAEFFGNFRSARNEIQGRYPSFTTYNFAFKKLLFHKKGSIGFTTTNPFNQYVNLVTNLYGKNFILTSYRKVPFRSFGISFSYQFGKLKFQNSMQDNNSDQSNPPGGGF
ncbi:MAG: outer membrane beta-barrel family protein [Chitinophagaceae bacterium]